jgi:hypothetical protein
MNEEFFSSRFSNSPTPSRRIRGSQKDVVGLAGWLITPSYMSLNAGGEWWGGGLRGLSQ